MSQIFYYCKDKYYDFIQRFIRVKLCKGLFVRNSYKREDFFK
jgi:hypothetical protein